jgi:hypothetical protein
MGLTGWDATSWTGEAWSGTSWTDHSWSQAYWNGVSWRDDSWLGVSWRGGTWEARSWRADSWQGVSWRDGQWVAVSWRDGSWEAVSWRDDSWAGVSWRADSFVAVSWRNRSEFGQPEPDGLRPSGSGVLRGHTSPARATAQVAREHADEIRGQRACTSRTGRLHERGGGCRHDSRPSRAAVDRPREAVWLLTLLMAVAAVAVVLSPGGSDYPISEPPTAGVVGLARALRGGRGLVIHLPSVRSAHTHTLREIPR